jgi:hypothetical protein
MHESQSIFKLKSIKNEKKKMWALFHVLIRGSYFRFDSIFIKKKVIKPKFKKKKKLKPVQTETGFGSVRFSGQKRFKPVWLGFFGLARFFSGFARVFSGFFLFGFGFFGFRFIKPNRTSRFFKILIDFYVFFTFWFFRLFFFWFFGFFTPS